MADEKNNFEPFIDWDGLDEEMSNDLWSALREFELAKVTFLKERRPENAARLMIAQEKISEINDAIRNTLFTLPMMVHCAGEKIVGNDDDGREEIIQRCTRCGSTLQQWKDGWGTMVDGEVKKLEADDLIWWEPGKQIAKATNDTTTSLYEIPLDRPLEKHELMCPDFAGELGDERKN